MEIKGLEEIQAITSLVGNITGTKFTVDELRPNKLYCIEPYRCLQGYEPLVITLAELQEVFKDSPNIANVNKREIAENYKRTIIGILHNPRKLRECKETLRYMLRKGLTD